MMKNFKRNLSILVIAQTIACSIALGIYASIALFSSDNKYPDQGNYPGSVGLRSYFQEGSGTEASPYVISRPIHFYNLTRLQNLGVFTNKTYFSLGYDADKTDADSSLKFYKTNSSLEQQSYLDMSEYTNNPLLAIGNESTPFYGDFNGNGLVVNNLKVLSSPEDVGVFGYTYTGSKVHDVFFKNLTITNNGYDKSINGLNNLYTSSDYGTLSYGGTKLTNNQITFSDTTSSFVPTMPTSLSGIKFEMRSSSEYITTNKKTNEATINQTGVNSSIYDNLAFTSNNATRLSVRLSIVGTLYDANNTISYSKVFSTYLVTFENSIVAGNSVISFKATIDYVDNTSESYTQYSHGTNIGYLIGHCDGSCENCFVYQGTLSMNNPISNYQVMNQETETGLIGEIGPAIKNEYGEKIETAQQGDTGVINFTKMYQDVVGSSTFSSFDTVYTYTPVEGNLFLNYLRNNYLSPVSYLTNTADSFDFLGQQIIKDELDADRGLGVFSLASSSISSSSYDTRLQGIGKFAVNKDSKGYNVNGVYDYTDFYYTTAEYAGDSTKTNWSITDWGINGSGSNELINGRVIPSYVDEYTINPEFEKRFNYIFKVPLESSYSFGENDPDYPNYFSNTNNAFLRAYFDYKIIDKTGSPIPYTSKDYGVFVKDVDKTTKITSNITNFDSYLSLSQIATGTKYEILDALSNTPASTINFSIENEGGANVTVMASSNSDTGAYVSIYDKSITLNNTYNVGGSRPNLHPAYTMYCPIISGNDNLDYFEYDNINRNLTSDKAEHFSNQNSDKLFCHTFTLPKGKYFISSPSGNANIYYVCAQGQNNKGNFGNVSNLYSNANVLKNIDFVGRDPTGIGYVYKETDRCQMGLKGNFSTLSGDFVVTSVGQVTSGDLVIDNPISITNPNNLSSLYIWNNKGYSITFNGLTFNDTYYGYVR